MRHGHRALPLTRRASHAVIVGAAASAVPAVQRSAHPSRRGLEQQAQQLKAGFVHTGDGVDKVIAACAQDHGQTPAG